MLYCDPVGWTLHELLVPKGGDAESLKQVVGTAVLLDHHNDVLELCDWRGFKRGSDRSDRNEEPENFGNQLHGTASQTIGRSAFNSRNEQKARSCNKRLWVCVDADSKLV